MKFGRTILAALGAILFSATLLATSASAEAQRIPASVEVSTLSGATVTPVGTLDSSCGDYRICFWGLQNYAGAAKAELPLPFS